MPDSRPNDGAVFGDQLNLLTTEIRQLSDLSPRAALEYACARLSAINPLSSAGIFRQEKNSDALQWMHLSDGSADFMNQSLEQNEKGLSDILTNGWLKQFDPAQNSGATRDIFIGVPAGDLEGEPVGLGLSSTRALEDVELSRLGFFALMLGLIAENARLSNIVANRDDSSSSARLIGFIAHELRTPLTGMRGNIQLALMASRKGQHDRVPKRLEAAINGVDDMSALVQQLLDVSRLERGTFQLNLGLAGIGQTIASAIDAVSTEDQFAPRSVRVIHLDDVTLEHDHAALQRAFCYLLVASGRYATEMSEIECSVYDNGDTVTFRIIYEGSAFSSDDQAVLSGPLASAQSASGRSDDLSLDLAFCRGIISHHNGQISLKSDSGAPGTHTIEITLPRHIS
jgi:signal transduction histidine kinase